MSFKHTTFTVEGDKKNQYNRYPSLKTNAYRPQHNNSSFQRSQEDLLQGVRRPNDQDFPSVEIIILNEACWESLHWVFVEL